MPGGRGERQDGGDARVGTGEVLRPLVSRPGPEDRGEARPELRPGLSPGRRRERLVGQPETRQQRGVELRFERPDRDVPTVGAGVGAVEGGAPVEQVVGPVLGPGSGCAHRPDDLREHADAVDHRRVHDLAASGSFPLPQRGQQTHEQEHRAAAEVADQVERRRRRLTGSPDRIQHTGQREVVDVVAGPHRERTDWPQPVIRP